MAPCVKNKTNRRLFESASVPPINENNIIGATRASPMAPRAMGSFDRVRTCQSSAQVCISEPATEIINPNHSKRNSR